MSPLLQLHLLILLIATTAVLGKLISIPAPALVTWRTALAALGAFLWVVLRRRRKMILPARQVAPLLGIGAIIALHWICFFGAIDLSNVSICLAGMATTSLFTAFTEPLFERRRIRPFEVLLGLLVVVGIGVVAGIERRYLAGLGVALLAALLAAVFPVLNRHLVTRGSDPMVMVGWEMAGACATCLLLLPVLAPDGYATLFRARGDDWLWILCLAWACTVFAHGFHIHLLRHLSAYTANLAINFEPVYGILAGALIFREYEELRPGFYLGTLAILAANFLHPWLERRQRATRNP